MFHNVASLRKSFLALARELSQGGSVNASNHNYHKDNNKSPQSQLPHNNETHNKARKKDGHVVNEIPQLQKNHKKNENCEKLVQI